MRASLNAFILLAGFAALPCFADGMEPPAQAAPSDKSAKAAAKAPTPAKTGKTAKPEKTEATGKTDATAKAEAPTKTEATAATPKAKSATKAKTAKKPTAPAGPDDLTPQPIRHVAVCPPPKIAPCVMRKPVSTGYRVLTTGVDVADDGANWIVDFGRGPKAATFLLQVLETGGRLHEVEVKFHAKAGMQRVSALPAE